MKKLANTRHPIQPLGKDDAGIVRFKANAVVQYLLDNGGIDMNKLAALSFPREDREQFAQLIGYSFSGAHDLGYVSSETLAAAEKGGTDDARVDVLRGALERLREQLRVPMAELFEVHPDDLGGGK